MPPLKLTTVKSRCGTAGLTVASILRRHIGAMLQSIEHRGRDDEGVWTSVPIDEAGRCARSRASPAGNYRYQQSRPSADAWADGRYALTFGGEIYNYRELREEL